MKTLSAKSPKNRFRASITYSKPLSEIGSSSSVMANDIETLKDRVLFYTKQASKNNTTSYITISENKSEYPFFNWVEVESYGQ